jgi:hypothetical protein
MLPRRPRLPHPIRVSRPKILDDDDIIQSRFLQRQKTYTFWNYYGGKYRIAPRYPKPKFHTIIEPFAGAAGYSLRHHYHHVLLIDKSPIICGIWNWLISESENAILSIPCVEHVNELPFWVPQEAKWYVGFCLNQGTTTPCLSLSGYCKLSQNIGCKVSGWTTARRDRTAKQLKCIRHWKIIQGDYSSSPNIPATWFIDPPYQKGGERYTYSSKQINYLALADWCKCRKGQVMVCENGQAAWLPFRSFHVAKGFKRDSHEVIWP